MARGPRQRRDRRAVSGSGIKYVMLAFEPYPTGTGEHPADRFLRQFENYRGMRQQVGAIGAAELLLTPAEERALWQQGADEAEAEAKTEAIKTQSETVDLDG